jgi:hypothetical protein
LANKGLTAGAGISLSSDAVSVTVTNSSPASSVTLASAGGTETLVNDGTGPALATKGLTAGAGISLTGAATSVTIAATGGDAGLILHSIRRSAAVAISPVPNFHAYNTTLIAINGTYWSYDGAGTWTCVANHRAEVIAWCSWGVTGVNARVIGDIVLNAVTSLQTQRNGAYSTTSIDGETVVSRSRDWTAGETFRVYWYTSSGAAQTYATENVVTIRKG